MKKEIKKYLEIDKKIKNTKENLKKINVEIKNIYNSAKYIDIFKGEKKQELDNLHKKENQLLKCEEIQTIESNLIYNNISSSFFDKYNDEIIKILKKYENKNIGEKTTDKIEEEIKTLLSKDFNYTIYVYLRINKDYYSRYNDGELTINFKTRFYNQEWESNILNIKYNFEKENYNCYDEDKKLEKYYFVNTMYNYNDNTRLAFYKNNELKKDINYIENTKEIATKIYNHSIKAKNEIEKHKIKMQEIRKKLDYDIQNLSYGLKKDMEIPYSIYL